MSAWTHLCAAGHNPAALNYEHQNNIIQNYNFTLEYFEAEDNNMD